MALKAAVERVIVEHARQGLPVYIWRDGKVVKLSPEELRAEAARLETEPYPAQPFVRPTDTAVFRLAVIR